MIKVYTAAHIIDAQMVLDELQAGGLQAHISGSYLSGAVGELPPDALISVWIGEPRHAGRARQIIDEFEASRQVDGPQRTCRHCGERMPPQFGRCWQCGGWMHDP